MIGRYETYYNSDPKAMVETFSIIGLRSNAGRAFLSKGQRLSRQERGNNQARTAYGAWDPRTQDADEDKISACLPASCKALL